MEADVYPSSRQYLDRIRTRPGPFTDQDAFDGNGVVDFVNNMKIL
jgi:ubiquitin-activating enzyme E1 C